MPTALKTGLARVGAFIGGFSTAQRVLAVLGIGVLVLGVASLSLWLSRPSYAPLFSGLSGSDASAIVEQLRTANVPYELADGGSTVLVPQESVYDQRIKAAAAGLPASSTGGYGLLDKMGVTTSSFQQTVTYKRAIEGELANTISAMRGVKTASVKLALPEDTVFVSQKTDPTASVFVETVAGAHLSTEQVNAITHLTSAAVEGMTAKDVAVIDADGNVLSAVGTGASGTADTRSGDYETRVRQAVQQMLDRIVGTGNSTVAVAATVSDETAQVTSEQFGDTTGKPALNESTNTENFTGSGGSQAGVLGPDNIAVPGGANNGNGTFSSNQTVRNNAVDKITETRTIPAGAVARQTVSVAIDRKAAKSLSVADVTALVTAAAGIDAKRGDAVSVQLVDFSTADATKAGAALRAADAQAERDRVDSLIRMGVLAAAVLVVGVVGSILIARRLRSKREPLALEEPMPHYQQIFDVALDPPAALETQPLPQGPDPAETRRLEIARMAQQDPERAAQLLRAMLDDRSAV